MRFLLIIFFLMSCNPFHTSEQRKAYALLQLKSKEAVINFINQYAQYPETYQPISFGHFVHQPGRPTNDGNERYSWFHEFNIRNLAGDTIAMKTYFFLNQNFVVCAVYDEQYPNGNYAYSSLKLWTTTVGRPLTEAELRKFKEQFRVFNH